MVFPRKIHSTIDLNTIWGSIIIPINCAICVAHYYSWETFTMVRNSVSQARVYSSSGLGSIFRRCPWTPRIQEVASWLILPCICCNLSSWLQRNYQWHFFLSPPQEEMFTNCFIICQSLVCCVLFQPPSPLWLPRPWLLQASTIQ